MSKAVVVRRPVDVKQVARPAVVTQENVDAAEARAATHKAVCNRCLAPRRGVQRNPSGCSTVSCPHHRRCFLCGAETDGRFVLVPAS